MPEFYMILPENARILHNIRCLFATHKLKYKERIETSKNNKDKKAVLSQR